MKKLISITFLLVALTAFSFSDTTLLQISTQQNTNCESAYQICQNVSQSFDFRDRDTTAKTCQTKAIFYKFQMSNASSFSIKLMQTSGNYILYGPFSSESLFNCQSIYNYAANSVAGTLNIGINSTVNLSSGYFILQIKPTDCFGQVQIRMNQRYLTCNENVSCQDCVSSFSPMPGRYVVSAWVKENNATQSTTTYTKPYLRVTFAGATNAFNLIPSGKIIDGWQKIDSVITIPSSAASISIALKVTSGEAYFDDIRFFPLDGSMMSYVYDPVNLRLMAELDERNYATFYEYDEEGKLIRIKKETEKGVMTIQENRDNILKY